jgi:hypothetical protein
VLDGLGKFEGKGCRDLREPFLFSDGISTFYLSGFALARKTPSSMATERVNNVASCPDNATVLPFPLTEGPASFATPLPSPGTSEIFDVFGVQAEAPMQVSRTKTWRKPLFVVPDVEFAGEPAAFAA